MSTIKGGVGRSTTGRTEFKHRLMWTLTAQEIGAASNLRPRLRRAILADACTGDADPGEREPWERHTSAGIYAANATHCTLDETFVGLAELAPATYKRLLARLKIELPKLGYEQQAENEWMYRQNGANVLLRAVCQDSSTLDLSGSRWLRQDTSLLLFSDPNSMSHDPFRMDLLNTCRKAGMWAVRGLLVAGCNPSGIQGVLTREDREKWFGQVKDLVAYQRRSCDVLIGAIEAANGRLEAAKWAYMLFTTTKGSWGKRAEQAFSQAARHAGLSLRTCWASDEATCTPLLQQLFLTQRERVSEGFASPKTQAVRRVLAEFRAEHAWQQGMVWNPYRAAYEWPAGSARNVNEQDQLR